MPMGERLCRRSGAGIVSTTVCHSVPITTRRSYRCALRRAGEKVVVASGAASTPEVKERSRVSRWRGRDVGHLDTMTG